MCAEHSDFVCSHIVSVNYLKIIESQNWPSWKGPLRVIWSCSSAHFSSVVVVPFLCASHVYLLMPQTFPSGAVGWRGSTIWVNNVSCSIKLTSVSHCLLFTPNAGTAVFSFPPPPLETRTRCPWSSAAAAPPAAPPAAGDASGYILAAWRPGALCALLLAGDGGTKSRRGAAGPYGALCRRRGGGRCRGARRRPCRRRARDAAQGGHLGGAAASGRAAEGRGGHQVALLSERQRGTTPPRLAPSRPSGAAGRPGPARRAVRVAQGQGRSVPTAACCWVGKPGTGGITDGGALINGRIVCGVLGDVCSAPIALAVVSALLPAAEHVRQEERAAVEPTSVWRLLGFGARVQTTNVTSAFPRVIAHHIVLLSLLYLMQCACCCQLRRLLIAMKHPIHFKEQEAKHFLRTFLSRSRSGWCSVGVGCCHFCPLSAVHGAGTVLPSSLWKIQNTGDKFHSQKSSNFIPARRWLLQCSDISCSSKWFGCVALHCWLHTIWFAVKFINSIFLFYSLG